MAEKAPYNMLRYRIAQGASWLVSRLIFRVKYKRNHLKYAKGPYVVIANHQAALDFVNLITATSRPMTFVISQSFFSTLPIRGFIEKMGVIPKQQFQTTATDLKKMKREIDAGRSVAIYPAGLMCEDGLTTPIPTATYKLLKWLGVDVYMARTRGAYHVMPKWGKGFRPGRTYMDIYKLFDAKELAQMPLEIVRERTEEALEFDAYREQEKDRSRHMGQSIQGLENVLYRCPHCGGAYTITTPDKETFLCTACGFTAKSDPYGLLECPAEQETKVRYISDWSLQIQQQMERELRSGKLQRLSCATQILTVHPKKPKFQLTGSGTLTLENGILTLEGENDAQPIFIRAEAAAFPILPFSPGKHLEVQDGNQIYRCRLSDGRQVMAFIHMLKLSHKFAQEAIHAPQVI